MRFTITWFSLPNTGGAASRRPCWSGSARSPRRGARDGGGKLLEVNGEPDHVHLLVSLPPNLDLSNFVNNLKTTSSRLLRKEFAEHLAPVYRKPVFWSRSYCIISCGGAPLSIIRQYIEQQERPE
jgi:putative transposase